ncbi:DUF2975 domain-containing protein [Actinomycetospora lutea]|uniref:DUF2975 domain-containing protein n=1 Tax=Actinomycetospora lutea TaxID=663604 RepID=UPI002365DCB4|nr:DUF2975 domain-containing protein [Actinomycetospora lutea]MDD7942182.1 DUF2975 domain-containing protein [Actinomycetospora lutea]
MSPLVIVALRALLVGIALGALAAQVAIVVAVVLALGAGGITGIAVLYAVLGVGALAALEVGLVALWVLLGMVRREAIFDDGAFRWVRVVTVAGFVAALLVAAACMHYGEIDDAPGLILIGGGIAVGGTAYALLMVVMRGLLANATVLRRELDEVV